MGLMLRVLFLFALVIGVASCGNLNKVPRYDLDEHMMPKQFKRFAKYDEQDFIIRWAAEAWHPNPGEIEQPISVTMDETLHRHGPPDYIRVRFFSESNELVDQWAWWDRGTTVQFVQGELVWEGPLTDMDQYLIRHGYPQKAMYSSPVSGTRRDIFTYSDPYQAPMKQVTFTNEKLTSEFRF